MVVISDMEMPKNCEDCPFSSCKGRLNDFYCDVTTFDVDIESEERDADCPLKEVPSGKWILDRAIVRCSNCGKGYKDAFGKPRTVTFNYCPNCSSRNVVEEQTGDKT